MNEPYYLYIPKREFYAMRAADKAVFSYVMNTRYPTMATSSKKAAAAYRNESSRPFNASTWRSFRDMYRVSVHIKAEHRRGYYVNKQDRANYVNQHHFTLARNRRPRQY